MRGAVECCWSLVSVSHFFQEELSTSMSGSTPLSLCQRGGKKKSGASRKEFPPCPWSRWSMSFNISSRQEAQPSQSLDTSTGLTPSCLLLPPISHPLLFISPYHSHSVPHFPSSSCPLLRSLSSRYGITFTPLYTTGSAEYLSIFFKRRAPYNLCLVSVFPWFLITYDFSLHIPFLIFITLTINRASFRPFI